MLVSKDVLLTYTNAVNMTLGMAFFNQYFLLDCREQLQNNISGEKAAGYDGELLTGMNADVRHIEITGFFDTTLNRRAMEGELKRVFNIGCAGTLEYYHRKDKRRYTIQCYPEKLPEVIFSNNRVEYVINLKCLDPYWYGEEITLNIPRYALTFENTGDSATGAVFELTGTANTPVIANGHGQQIAFKGNLAGQTLRITSMPERSMVELDGVNAMRYLTDAERRFFFLLDIGTNTVSYNAASGADGLAVKLKYRPRFLGTF